MKERRQLDPYHRFSKAEWAAYRDGEPMTLSGADIERLRALTDPISLTEAEEIYLPLSRLISFYVEAAQALGISTFHIMTRHVLRNLLSPILVQASFLFASAMLAEAGLSFLGLGVSPEIPTWGTMIAAGRQYIGQADWMTYFPGFAIILSVLSLQMVGDGLRDMLDPRLRRDL